MLLGVNIDHSATLRQARYAQMLDSENAEPSVLEIAQLAWQGGADSITLHVRGDRRHIQEADAFLIRKEIPLPLNLEMGNTADLLDIALRLKPDYVCMVPEKREEITTEGGLNCIEHFDELQPTLVALAEAGIKVSMFIDPERDQIEAAHRLQAPMIELHTGCFANAGGAAKQLELERLADAARYAHGLGMQVNAGHGINYKNISLLKGVPHLTELNIGHSILCRALIVGMKDAVAQMKDILPYV